MKDKALIQDAISAIEWLQGEYSGPLDDYLDGSLEYACTCDAEPEPDTNAVTHTDECAVIMENHIIATLDALRAELKD